MAAGRLILAWQMGVKPTFDPRWGVRIMALSTSQSEFSTGLRSKARRSYQRASASRSTPVRMPVIFWLLQRGCGSPSEC